jgi:hypothetical protein
VSEIVTRLEARIRASGSTNNDLTTPRVAAATMGAGAMIASLGDGRPRTSSDVTASLFMRVASFQGVQALEARKG